ncbi:TetR/AcrR family transcriptional regulator [Paraburkholderia xenovorans]|uniref:Transcriptional regulator, TetR family n=1 Tax=Paraburkholderia xenovorans (strain LB400) TaxID=266265 RepID=Q13ZZ0_PARXL|nr:TetR/AcrR family transcriptional regulator [Paraburkholderia xenovorans]ABE30319.1 transcriptional regulator, TetR family [Paraburkholderia xenovorans LB400]ABE30349.1 transcriptional regulator, TetR family [Paraburkholderia xenovorans LB400]
MTTAPLNGADIPSRREGIVNAASETFLRYGYARTTMADLAKAAGLSRPLLYLEFQDKADVFRAVAEQVARELERRIRAELDALPNLRTQLNLACEIWVVETFDLISAHPDAKDFFDLGPELLGQSYDAFEVLIADILSRAGAKQARALARLLVSASKGFKESASDGKDLRKLLQLQIDALVGYIERNAHAAAAPHAPCVRRTRRQ